MNANKFYTNSFQNGIEKPGDLSIPGFFYWRTLYLGSDAVRAILREDFANLVFLILCLSFDGNKEITILDFFRVIFRFMLGNTRADQTADKTAC